MKKIYLVDSENVGDVWVPLLVASQEEDVIFVFYTQKSPHMNYENVRMLKETEKEAVFIKCFEGSNALDFQLVTELGYMLRENADCEYVIVSNDMGFDAVVRYWCVRKMPVRRISGKDVLRQVNSKGQQREKELTVSALGVTSEADKTEEMPEIVELAEPVKQSDTEEAALDEARTLEKSSDTEETEQLAGSLTEEDTQAVDSVAEDTEENVQQEQAENVENTIRALFRCIGKDNLADFHNVLVMFFGEENGKELYQEIKGNPEWTTEWAQISDCSQKEKFDIYCKEVFEHSELARNYPQDFSAFLFKANGKRKNLNSLRAALQGQYGKDKGMKYYSLFKSHIKIMNRM